MTIKRKRIYEIIIFSLVIILTSLCAYMGITAVQKSMKLKLSFAASPVVFCEVLVNGKVVFDNSAKKIDDGVSLSGNALTFNSAVSQNVTLGESFSLQIKNHLATESAILISFNGATISTGEIVNSTSYSEIIAKDNFSKVLSVSTNEMQITMSKVIPVTLSLGAGVTLTSSNIFTSTNGAQCLPLGEDLEATISLEANYENPTFTFNGEPVAITDKKITIPAEDLVDGNTEIDVSAEPQLPYTIKAYDGTNTAAWGGYYCVEFGEYPQTLVTDVSPSPTDISYTYGGNTFKIYVDGNDKYATITRGGTEYENYYKFEPIRWIIVGAGANYSSKYMPSDAPASAYAGGDGTNTEIGENQVLLLSEFGLYKEFFDSRAIVYKFGNDECDLQVSLNGSFAEMAGLKQYFSSNELDSLIEIMTLTSVYDGNSVIEESSHNMFVLGSTSNSSYYYGNYMMSNSTQVQPIPTSYATATTVSVNSGFCNWWLRDGGSYFEMMECGMACFYQTSGTLVDSPSRHGTSSRPAFVLNLA